MLYWDFWIRSIPSKKFLFLPISPMIWGWEGLLKENSRQKIITLSITLSLTKNVLFSSMDSFPCFHRGISVFDNLCVTSFLRKDRQSIMRNNRSFREILDIRLNFSRSNRFKSSVSTDVEVLHDSSYSLTVSDWTISYFYSNFGDARFCGISNCIKHINHFYF